MMDMVAWFGRFDRRDLLIPPIRIRPVGGASFIEEEIKQIVLMGWNEFSFLFFSFISR